MQSGVVASTSSHVQLERIIARLSGNDLNFTVATKKMIALHCMVPIFSLPREGHQLNCLMTIVTICIGMIFEYIVENGMRIVFMINSHIKHNTIGSFFAKSTVSNRIANALQASELPKLQNYGVQQRS